MRFQKSPPPKPFSGRDRIIVLLFLGALGIFLAVRVGSNPKFWKAINKKPGETEPVINNDPSLLRNDENLFSNGGDLTPEPTGPVTIDAAPTLTIPRDKLKPVRDNTMGIRSKELPAYYATLRFVRDTSPADLNQMAERVPYTMLMAEPWVYRGKPIELKGRLRRLVPIKAGMNSHGLEQLYDAWVFTDDSGSNPFHVICSAPPKGVEPAEVYRNDPPEVSLVGYFFKTQGYQSQGDGSEAVSLHTAPLILAANLTTKPAVVAETRDLAAEMVPWLWWFALGVAALLGMVLWNFAMSDWSFRQTRAHGILHPQITPDFEGVDALSTSEMLYELSRDGNAGIIGDPFAIADVYSDD